MRVTTGPLTGHLVEFGLLDNPECNRYKQASETVSLVLDDSETLTSLCFSHLAYHFLMSCDFVVVSSIPSLCSKCGAAACLRGGRTEDGKRSRCKFVVVPALMYSRFLENIWTSLLERK
jgi:hypothetical protein